MNRPNSKVTALAAVEAALAIVAVFLAAFVRFQGDLPSDIDLGLVWMLAGAFAVVVLVALTAMGLYQIRQRLTFEGVLVRILLGLVFAATALLLIFYIFSIPALGRGWMLLSMAFMFVFLACTRYGFSKLVDQNVFRRRVLIYGAGKRAEKLLQLRRRSDQRGFQILAFIPVPGEDQLFNDERVDRSQANVLELAKKHDADEIVIAMDDRRQSFPIRDLLECKFAGIEVVDVLTFLERESGRINVDLLNPSWLIFAEGFTQRTTRATVSRVFDLAVSIGVLIVVWPLMLLTALAILLEDGRPVLYRQIRVGLLGRPFELLKFRSMTRNAEANGAIWAQKNDRRITKVGAVIRKLRFDELPQLFNIIRGDMRLIGPRPERPEFVEQLAQKIPYYHERHCVKPGLTGWAQLSYPYGSSERDALEKLQFDLYYVKNQSLIFDLVILLQTVEVVIWGKGAR